MEDESELGQLRSLLAKEKHATEMLELSIAELQNTADDLDKRMEGFEEDNCEWKTRFETQLETNQQLHVQNSVLNKNFEFTRKLLKDVKLSKNHRLSLDSEEITPRLVRTLEKDIMLLENQLHNLEWRLDQESKAYHKANEERKNCVLELRYKHNLTGNVVDHIDVANDSPRIPASNIAEDQRVIDTKKGPIRKTAAVRTLPRLQ